MKFGLAYFQPKHHENVGSGFRSAYTFGAKYLVTIGRRYRRQSTDTVDSCKHIPYYHFERFKDFKEYFKKLQWDIVAVELSNNAKKLTEFNHPIKAIYLMGNEVYGIHEKIMVECDHIVYIPTKEPISINVSCAANIVMWDRLSGKNYG